MLDLTAMGNEMGCMRCLEPDLYAAWYFLLHLCRWWRDKGLFCRLNLDKTAIASAHGSLYRRTAL